MASSPNLDAVHHIIAQLSEKDIRALHAFGIQQAGRQGLHHDSRFFILLGLIALIISLINPLTMILRGAMLFIAIGLCVWSIKSYVRPTIADMRWMVGLLGLSTIINGLNGIFSIVTLNQLQIAYGIILLALSAVEARWALNLWGAYQVATTSNDDLNNASNDILQFYVTLSQILATIPPQPDNSIVRFGRGNQAMRLFLSHPYAVILQQNGMIRFLPPSVMAMRPNEESSADDLTVYADLMLNQRVVHGDVSQLSFKTFQKWQENLS